MYHINDKGEPGACRATKKECPYGGVNEHFSTKEEASQYYESQQKYFSVSTSSLQKPDFDIDDYELFWKPSADLLLPEEKKNKGEYSEIYAAQLILTGAQMPPLNGKPLKLREMTLGVGDGKVDYIMDDGKIYFQTSDKKIFKASVDSTENSRLLKAITGGTGRSFACPEVQSTCRNLGFVTGRLPKALSTEKADIVGWDENGKQRRISVKSYLGGEPAIINCSKSSQVNYTARTPEDMTPEKMEDIVSKANSLPTTKQKIAYLRLEGVIFDPAEGECGSQTFKDNLGRVSDNAEKAYAAAVFTSVSNSKVPKEYHEDYKKVLTAFATRMTHTNYYPDSEVVTDILTINKNTGNARTIDCTDEKFINDYLSKRVTFNEPAKGKFDSGIVSVENGKIKMMLNASGTLYESQKNDNPIN